MKIKYGLTSRNVKETLDKIERQKDFLYSHFIESAGKKISLASFSRNSYINTDRYIGELQNRVWSLVNYAESRKLVNLFITLTLPSQYHRKKTLGNGKQIRNPKFAYQDIEIYDIITKKRPKYMYKHEFKIHKSIRLNYWTGKVTHQTLWSRSSLKKYETLRHVKTFDDFILFLDNVSEDIDVFLRENLKNNVSIFDIRTRERVFYYSSLVLKQKPISRLPRWTGKFDNISLNPIDFMPLNATKQLTDMWTKIRKDRAWKDLDKDDRIYFRVTEPHKDGTPHVHISAFVPDYAVTRLVQAIHRIYPAPLADISSSYIPDGYDLYKNSYKRNGKWHSAYKPSHASKTYIKVHIDSAVSYLMKYIYKTLDDLRDDKGISEITMWYLYHGICRFYTSRTLVSLSVYRPLNGRFGDLLQVTKMYRDETITVFIDIETRQPKIMEYSNDYGEEFIIWSKKDFELKQYDKDDKKSKGTMSIRTIDIQIDGEEYYMFRAGTKLHKKGTYIDISDAEYNTPVTRMKMVQLWNYYHSLDVDDPTLNIKHFGHVQNTMIERGLLEGEILPLDSFNTDFLITNKDCA